MPAPARKNVRRAPSGVVAKPGAPATVTLKHLAANLSQAHDMSKKQAEAVLGDLVGLVTKHLKKGDRVRIGGLGILAVRKRAARTGRNPATGTPIHIKASMKGVADVVMTAATGASNVPAEKLTTASAYEPAASAYEPSARAQALLRGKEICENDLKATAGSYTLEDVETLLGISRQAIDKKVRDDALLAVPGPHRRRRYPVVQFTADGILPGLRDVLKSLPSANGWFRLNFLINPDSHLGGRRPVDLLKEDRVDPVVRAAKAIGVQGA
jgi:nucleoid DNA-binding protein